MKKFIVNCCVTLFVLGVVDAASASSITHKDLYDAGHCYMYPNCLNSSVSWTFNITDYEFNPETQDATSANVSVDATLKSRKDDYYSNTGILYADSTGSINFALKSKAMSILMFGIGLNVVAFIGRKRFVKA